MRDDTLSRDWRYRLSMEAYKMRYRPPEPGGWPPCVFRRDDHVSSLGWMNKAIFDEVAVLWAGHLEAPWPDDLYRVDDRDGDVVEIDAAMAGCVSVYVKSRGALDEERSHVLHHGARALRRILPRLRGEGAVYVRRLIQMAELINEDRRSAG
jgi:hypothetical protein